MKKGPVKRLPPPLSRVYCLDCANVLCLPALGALHDVELNLLAFLQRPEAVALDGAVMHEDVFARGAAEKTKTLGVVKPLNCSVFHLTCSSLTLCTAERNLDCFAS